MKLWSLRRSLVIGVNLAVVVVLLITAWSSYRDIIHELDEVFDAQLAQTAKSIAEFYIPTDLESSPQTIPISDYVDKGEGVAAEMEKGPSGHKYESKIGYQIYSNTGHMLAHTDQSDVPWLKNLKVGYETIKSEDKTWLVYSYCAHEKSIWVHAFQREDVRDELAGYLASGQIYPLLLMWAPISLVVLFLVYLILKPVNKFAFKLRAKTIDDLESIDIDLPKELSPVKSAINQLLGQIKMFSYREKRFIADASHELRTPLSAIQVHAENITTAKSIDDAKQSGEAIVLTIVRMTHLVNQLLLLNRLDTSEHSFLDTEFDLRAVISNAIDNLPINQVEQYQWRVQIPTVILRGNEYTLISAFTNLLSNAMKFSPIDSTIAIKCHEADEHITIQITDQGKGLPETVLERMGERFYRFREHSSIPGSGLGLSITSKIIDLHDGEITYKNVLPTGLEVRIFLPKRPPKNKNLKSS